MNLGDLISLLVVVLFVASAFLGRRDRGGRRRAPPQGPRPGEVREEREAPADGRTPASSTEASSPNQSSEESPLQRRLEEARRKVREAASGEGSATTVSRRPSAERGGSLADGETSVGGGPVHPRPGGTGSGGGAPSGRPSTSPSPSPFGPPPDRPRPQTDRPRPTIGQGPRAHAAQTRSEGSSSQRKRRPSSAKLSAAELLAFEREDIVRGFVWSVIYSDPVSMRAMRRKVSPRRLP